MFDSTYEVVLADTIESQRIHFKLRYKIYCLEEGYEDPLNFPKGYESDSYDKSSVHFIVRERQTGEWIAAMRLVISNMGCELPVREYCRIAPKFLKGPLSRPTAELSRLCILPEHRGGSAHFSTMLGREKVSEPEVVFGLLRAARVFCELHGIVYWFGLIRPSLARILAKSQIPLIKAGEMSEGLRGRYPYYSEVTQAFARLDQAPVHVQELFSSRPAYRLYSDPEFVVSIPSSGMPSRGVYKGSGRRLDF